MTRTIYVIFPNFKDGVIKYEQGAKQYAFLCNYDNVYMLDKIVDPRYSSPMLVVGINSNTDRVQNGLTLKDIYITMVNDKPISQPSELVNGSIAGSDFDIDKQRNNNMEKRNIKVSLEQAIEWYNSDNKTLRTLALTVFTEEELTLNIHYIYNKVVRESICINIPSMEASKNIALAELSLIAKYFNGDWKKTTNNTGYFLAQFNTDSLNDIIKGVRIVAHNTIMYPGIVYFKEKEDLIKAVKILEGKVKNLFK